MTEDKLVEALKELSIFVTKDQLNQLEKYYQLLVEWNSKMNLTGITDKEQIYLKHFYDSATLAKAIDLNKVYHVCDVGSGAGFPGLVLKILFPNLQVTLVDSLRKRIEFLNMVIQTLNLGNIEALHCRVEEYAKIHRECFDLVTARAVAPLNILSEYCLPMVKNGKYFIAMKGDISQEIKGKVGYVSTLGGGKLEVIKFFLPFENSHRSLIKIQKLVPSSLKYPRRYSDMKKKPLK